MTHPEIRGMESQRVLPPSPAQQVKEERTTDESSEKPHRNLRRCEHGARQRVCQNQKNRTGNRRNWQKTDVIWPQDQPCHVRNNQSHEADDSSQGDSSSG